MPPVGAALRGRRRQLDVLCQRVLARVGVVNETDGYTRRTQDRPPDVFLVKTWAYSE